MNCSEFLAQLGDFLDNQVPTGLVAELQAHLDGCEHCLITMQTTQKTIQIYRNHEVYELPAGLRDAAPGGDSGEVQKGLLRVKGVNG